MSLNEDTLKQLMDAIDGASPSDFAEALDSALKIQCADLIDQRREELAAEIHEAKCDKKMDEEDDDDDDETIEEEEKADKDYDGDGEVESGKDEYFGSRKKAAQKKGEWSEEYEEEDDEDEVEESYSKKK